uniref:Amine oxidase n=1 Tax=Coccidioides posadasii RMSCC 3488 TaxID=454284 RepID=A0A0J6FKZ1_COCPO|nr:amine oxidase [Coccidioides posadasii RMSCC 3488]
MHGPLPSDLPRSREGYHWTPHGGGGVQQGLPTLAAIRPETNVGSPRQVYDVIVVGAGYAGLTAARNAAREGLNILLLEARDRIGGRSWSSNIDGYAFELGGTWIHWAQPHTFREVYHYNMKDELEISQDYTRGVNHFQLITADGVRTMSHLAEDQLLESAVKKFVDVDGNLGRTVMPFPHTPTYNPDIAKWDKLSMADRIEQIKDDLTPAEKAALEGFVLLCSGGTPENTGFYDILRWWALGFYTYQGVIDTCSTFKFHCGQSGFARRFFDEAVASKKVSYIFGCPITSVKDDGKTVQVTVQNGDKFIASRLICTIPVNVLGTIKFDPPLPEAKQQAIQAGQINQCSKVHAEVSDRDLRSWSAIAPYGKLINAFGDGTTPAGNTHIVAFGADLNPLHPEDDVGATKAAFDHLASMDIQRLVFHNWARDDYSRGAWCMFAPGVGTTFLETLRERHGNVLFANSDWATGWRGFIDGAIEEGARAAQMVQQELVTPSQTQTRL